MANLPNLLSCARLVLVPGLLTMAWSGYSGLFFCCLLASILTDTADGFLARRLNQTTDLEVRNPAGRINLSGARSRTQRQTPCVVHANRPHLLVGER